MKGRTVIGQIKKFKIFLLHRSGIYLPDISMRHSDHMNIELITGWETFTKANLTTNNTLFCATLFKKRILGLKFLQLNVSNNYVKFFKIKMFLFQRQPSRIDLPVD